MTDAHDIPRKRPRRAKPLQPDRPGPDDQQQASRGSDAAGVEAHKVDKQKRQSDTALKNVSEGYD